MENAGEESRLWRFEKLTMVCGTPFRRRSRGWVGSSRAHLVVGEINREVRLRLQENGSVTIERQTSLRHVAQNLRTFFRADVETTVRLPRQLELHVQLYLIHWQQLG